MYTFDIPRWLLIALGIALQMTWIIPLICQKVDKAKARKFARESDARIAKGKRDRELTEEKIQRRKDFEKILPEPWITAYDECEAMGDFELQMAWLRQWLLNVEVLPRLPVEAIKLFARMIGPVDLWSDNSQFDKAIQALMPYVKLPGTEKSREEDKKPEIPDNYMSIVSGSDEILVRSSCSCDICRTKYENGARRKFDKLTIFPRHRKCIENILQTKCGFKKGPADEIPKYSTTGSAAFTYEQAVRHYANNGIALKTPLCRCHLCKTEYLKAHPNRNNTKFFPQSPKCVIPLDPPADDEIRSAKKLQKIDYVKGHPHQPDTKPPPPCRKCGEPIDGSSTCYCEACSKKTPLNYAAIDAINKRAGEEQYEPKREEIEYYAYAQPCGNCSKMAFSHTTTLACAKCESLWTYNKYWQTVKPVPGAKEEFIQTEHGAYLIDGYVQGKHEYKDKKEHQELIEWAKSAKPILCKYSNGKQKQEWRTEQPPPKWIQGYAVVTPDENGHHWMYRENNISPFICTKCKAPSGTDKAIKQCLRSDEKKYAQRCGNCNKLVHSNTKTLACPKCESLWTYNKYWKTVKPVPGAKEEFITIRQPVTPLSEEQANLTNFAKYAQPCGKCSKMAFSHTTTLDCTECKSQWTHNKYWKTVKPKKLWFQERCKDCKETLASGPNENLTCPKCKTTWVCGNYWNTFKRPPVIQPVIQKGAILTIKDGTPKGVSYEYKDFLDREESIREAHAVGVKRRIRALMWGRWGKNPCDHYICKLHNCDVCHICDYFGKSQKLEPSPTTKKCGHMTGEVRESLRKYYPESLKKYYPESLGKSATPMRTDGGTTYYSEQCPHCTPKANGETVVLSKTKKMTCDRCLITWTYGDYQTAQQNSRDNGKSIKELKIDEIQQYYCPKCDKDFSSEGTKGVCKCGNSVIGGTVRYAAPKNGKSVKELEELVFDEAHKKETDRTRDKLRMYGQQCKTHHLCIKRGCEICHVCGETIRDVKNHKKRVKRRIKGLLFPKTHGNGEEQCDHSICHEYDCDICHVCNYFGSEVNPEPPIQVYKKPTFTGGSVIYPSEISTQQTAEYENNLKRYKYNKTRYEEQKFKDSCPCCFRTGYAKTVNMICPECYTMWTHPDGLKKLREMKPSTRYEKPDAEQQHLETVKQEKAKRPYSVLLPFALTCGERISWNIGSPCDHDICIERNCEKCHVCGYDIIYCKTCGTNYQPDWKKCKLCGNDPYNPCISEYPGDLDMKKCLRSQVSGCAECKKIKAKCNCNYCGSFSNDLWWTKNQRSS